MKLWNIFHTGFDFNRTYQSQLSVTRFIFVLCICMLRLIVDCVLGTVIMIWFTILWNWAMDDIHLMNGVNNWIACDALLWLESGELAATVWQVFELERFLYEVLSKNFRDKFPEICNRAQHRDAHASDYPLGCVHQELGFLILWWRHAWVGWVEILSWTRNWNWERTHQILCQTRKIETILVVSWQPSNNPCKMFCVTPAFQEKVESHLKTTRGHSDIPST